MSVWLRDRLNKGLWTYFYRLVADAELPICQRVSFAEGDLFYWEVVSITEDWSENEIYSAEDNDFSAEYFQNKFENVFN